MGGPMQKVGLAHPLECYIPGGEGEYLQGGYGFVVQIHH